ncbi:DNA-binding protein [Escherichia coli]
MYKKIQVEAATTDIKTLEQLLKKFRSVVRTNVVKLYQEIGEKKAHKLKMKRLQRMLRKWHVTRFLAEESKGMTI